VKVTDNRTKNKISKVTDNKPPESEFAASKRQREKIK